MAFIIAFISIVRISNYRLRREHDLTTNILETAGALIMVIDTHGQIIKFNRACELVSGYDRDQLIGCNILSTELFSECDNIREYLIHKPESKHSFEGLWITRERCERNISWTTTPLENQSEENDWIICTGIDVTEKRLLEDELLKVKKLESVGILAGGIAHDFNNILTAILGNISLARLELEGESLLDEMLSQAEKATMQARGLTNQLLTFSKGGMPVKKTTAIADLVLEWTNFALRGSNVTPSFTVDDQLWLVRIDEGQIHQVINNLVINGTQAMPDGGTLNISMENYTENGVNSLSLKPGNYVKISVIDEGIGIPEEHLSQIFDPYFTTKQKGHGLGLATSFSIIKKHNGHITVKSIIGVGTNFTLYLPASPHDTVESKTDDPIQIHHSGRILVLDDEEFVRTIAKRMLEKMGYSVEVAQTGLEAIKKYKTTMADTPFDVVIIDLTIRGSMGGEETLANLRRHDPNAIAIVSSGYSNNPIMSNFAHHGFNGVVRKPYKFEELSRVVGEVIHQNKQLRD